MKHNAFTALFLRQLANMLPAGIPVARCLDILAATQTNTVLKSTLLRIQQQLSSGQSLHQSLQVYPHLFNAYTCHIIALGEETGKLDLILDKLATYHEHRLEWQQRLQRALWYPTILLCTATLLTLLLFIFVIPTFAELFKEQSVKLPLLTRTLFYLSTLLKQILPLLGITLLLAWYNRHALLHYLVKSMPPLHHLQQSIQHIRFSRHLGIALAAGTSLLPALTLTHNMANQHMQTVIQRLKRRVNTGISLHKAMSECPELPLLLRQMTQIGEESGKLDQLLVQFAELAEKSLQHRINQLILCLEPLIITVLGVLIGGLVIGMYLPLFNLGSAL